LGLLVGASEQVEAMDDRILAGRYKLMGEGLVVRQGKILRALDTSLGRQVAIKLVRSNGEGQATLIREAKYLARFEHPHIVSLFDFFQVRDAVGFVMPWLAGHLGQTVSPRGDLDLSTTVAALHSIAKALDFCANNGVAHRDVKPSNILVGHHAAAFLSDFGIAAEFVSVEHWGGIVGTEPFIAPECFLAAHDDGYRLRSSRRQYDQFGLGVTTYQLLTGRIPFGTVGGDRKETCTALQLIKRKRFAPCHVVNERLPRTVDEVIARMLSVDPDDRYPNNVDAIAALESAAAGYGSGPQRIFISYSRADRALAEELARHLKERHGLDVWWDRSLVAGVDWGDQIEEAMEGSDLMIVLLSGNSAYSAEVKLEWRYWLDSLRRPLVSLVVEDCRIPYRLFSHQHLRMGENTGCELSAVAADIASLIPNLFRAFKAAVRRTAHLRGAPGAAAQLSLEDQPALAAAKPPSTDLRGATARGGDFTPDATFFATTERPDLDDFETLAKMRDRRRLEDFATLVVLPPDAPAS
jgi:hypothetical protein